MKKLALGLVTLLSSAMNGQFAIAQTPAEPCGFSINHLRESTVSFDGRRTEFRESIQGGCDGLGLPLVVFNYTAVARGTQGQIELRSDQLGERRAAFQNAMTVQGVTYQDRKFFVEQVMPLLREKKQLEASELWLQQLLK